jgi:MoaA/NifB/PqqE/SkfB family radical SAM enzyme
MEIYPQFLFIHVNKRCNLKCEHCSFWKLNDDDKSNYLSWSRKQEILQEFSELSPGASVVTCGGESMLDLEDYFAISKECRKLKLKNLSVANGTRIRDLDMAKRLVAEGPHEISISLNSHLEALHDKTRGVHGSFQKAVNALRLLVQARNATPNSTTKIYVMGLIFDENYQALRDFYDFVLNDVGADKLKLNFLQPSFGNDTPEDQFFANHYRIDPKTLLEIIEDCDRHFNLNLNPKWKLHVVMYFESLLKSKTIQFGWRDKSRTIEHICNSYDRNIMVDHYGFARLCFSNAFPGIQLEKFGDLSQFWNSSNTIRDEMRKCNRYCGISHSVRKENSTIKLA